MTDRERRMRWFWPFCLLLALAARAINFAPVFLQDGVRLIGTDPYYHLRRILVAVADYPFLPGFDPYLNYPEGALAPYEPGFDLLLATLARLAGLGAVLSDERMMAICAGVMPFLGLLILPLYGYFAVQLGERRAARVSVLFLALLPGVLFPSQLGQVDHHVLEPLLIGLVMLGLFRLFRDSGGMRTAILTGLALGLGLFFWRGMILPAALVASAIALRALFLLIDARGEQQSSPPGPPHGAPAPPLEAPDRLLSHHAPLLFAVAALASLPIAMLSPVSGRLSYFIISYLQPLIFGLLGLSLWMMGFTSRGLRRYFDRRSRGSSASEGPAIRALIALLAFVIVGLIPFLVAAEVFPSFLGNLFSGFGFLTRADVFVRAVGEQRPLFLNDDGQFSFLYPIFFYGLFIFAAPFLAYFACRYWPKQKARDHRWPLFIGWSVLALTMALAQRRYAAHFAPLYSIWLGLGLVALWERIRTLARSSHFAFSFALSVATLPTLVFIGVQAAVPVQPDALLRAMDWLRRNSPETSGYDLAREAGQENLPEYAVLGAWEEGHHILALAHRPNVANPFGIEWFKSGLERSARFWTAPASRVVAAMDETGARYALLSFRLGLLRDEASFLGLDSDRYALKGETGWQPGPDFAGLGSARLYLHDGLASAGSGPIIGLRLVWEGGMVSTDHPAGKWVNPGTAEYKLFERVACARLEGVTKSGQLVEARAPLVTRGGRKMEWKNETVSRKDGTFSIPACYADLEVPDGWVRASAPVRVKSGEMHVSVSVSDSQVRDGARIELEEFSER